MMTAPTLALALALTAAVVLLAQPATAQLGRLRNFRPGRDPIDRGTLSSMTGSSEETLGICSSTPRNFIDTSTTIPADFNIHEEYPSCKPVIRSQGTCGSCWAFATTGVFAQRLCVQSDDIAGTFQLAPQPLVSCTDEICFDTITGSRCSTASSSCRCSLGCSGGYPDGAFRYMTEESVALEVCVPYSSKDGTDGSTCPDVARDISSCAVTSNKTFTGTECYYHASNDLATVQRDIMQNGPVLATFVVYEDFYTYGSGVYTCPTGETSVGAHAVIVVGWGTEDGLDYWLIENSWGSGWGADGYVKIRRGTNECNIESSIVTTGVDTDNIVLSESVYSGAVAPSHQASVTAFALAAVFALVAHALF